MPNPFQAPATISEPSEDRRNDVSPIQRRWHPLVLPFGLFFVSISIPLLDILQWVGFTAAGREKYVLGDEFGNLISLVAIATSCLCNIAGAYFANKTTRELWRQRKRYSYFTLFGLFFATMLNLGFLFALLWLVFSNSNFDALGATAMTVDTTSFSAIASYNCQIP